MLLFYSISHNFAQGSSAYLDTLAVVIKSHLRVIKVIRVRWEFHDNSKPDYLTHIIMNDDTLYCAQCRGPDVTLCRPLYITGKVKSFILITKGHFFFQLIPFIQIICYFSHFLNNTARLLGGSIFVDIDGILEIKRTYFENTPIHDHSLQGDILYSDGQVFSRHYNLYVRKIAECRMMIHWQQQLFYTRTCRIVAFLIQLDLYGKKTTWKKN